MNVYFNTRWEITIARMVNKISCDSETAQQYLDHAAKFADDVVEFV